MSEITYNEEVTAEALNNIAVDLGSATFKYFEDNKPYAVEELNQITADLVSSGVLRTGENGALGCEVVLSNGKAYVQEGVIVFESGAKIRITEPVGIDIVPGTVIYVFYDSTTGKASLAASETTPSGDYVLLAQVDADGVIADRRSSCVSKAITAADAQNVYKEFTRDIIEGENVEIDIENGNFSYICLKYVIEWSEDGQHSWIREPYGANMKSLKEGESADFVAATDQSIRMVVTREGMRLKIYTTRIRNRGVHIATFMIF